MKYKGSTEVDSKPTHHRSNITLQHYLHSTSLQLLNSHLSLPTKAASKSNQQNATHPAYLLPRGPNALERRETQQVAQAIQFAVQADDCDLFKCAAVIASAACIGASIALGPAGIPSALGCTAGGASAVRPLTLLSRPVGCV
jgi:hypothetical protein